MTVLKPQKETMNNSVLVPMNRVMIASQKMSPTQSLVPNRVPHKKWKLRMRIPKMRVRRWTILNLREDR
jgi:hypothetical protein